MTYNVKEDLKNKTLEAIKKGNFLSKILGKEEVKKDIAKLLISGRHFILLGPAGIGKTTIAKEIVNLLSDIEVIDAPVPILEDEDNPLKELYLNKSKGKKILKGRDRFIRVQGSPDLEVEDLIGYINPNLAMQYGVNDIRAFVPGKLLKANHGILFFDEINRAPERIQNLLLEVLEEGTISIGAYNIQIPQDFLVIATMNPQDFAGTENVSEVFMDRFEMIELSYPSKEEELKVIKAKDKGFVKVDEKYYTMIVDFINNLRNDNNLVIKPSVRATLALLDIAEANALIESRKEVNLKDIQDAIKHVIPHRIKLKASLRIEIGEKKYVEKKLEEFLKKNRSNDKEKLRHPSQ